MGCPVALPPTMPVTMDSHPPVADPNISLTGTPAADAACSDQTTLAGSRTAMGAIQRSTA